MVIYHPMWRRNFTPPEGANEETEKRRVLSGQNHNFRHAIPFVLEECQELPILHQKENKQQVSATTHIKHCFEKMEGRSQTCLGKIIIPLPFNYNYRAKNSCIVLHSFIIVKKPHLWNMKIFNDLRMNTVRHLKPGLKY